MGLLSIGHSNHEIDAFISLLQMHGVTAIADVRSHPYSRFLPHFNQVSLKASLAKAGIQYVFLGQELGARPSNPDCYIDGKAVYERIAATDLFHVGIQRLKNGLNKHTIALMCAEQDPLTCHRAVLICQHLRDLQISIHHILKNGDLESHEHLEERLLIKHGFRDFADTQEAQLSLFPQNSLPTQAEYLREVDRLH